MLVAAASDDNCYIELLSLLLGVVFFVLHLVCFSGSERLLYWAEWTEHKSVCKCRCVDMFSSKGRSLFDHLSTEETLLNWIQNMTDKVIVYGGRGGLGMVIVDAFKVWQPGFQMVPTFISGCRLLGVVGRPCSQRCRWCQCPCEFQLISDFDKSKRVKSTWTSYEIWNLVKPAGGNSN